MVGNMTPPKRAVWEATSIILLIDQFLDKGRCLLIPKYFCAVYDYAGKGDLSKGYWNPKRKLGVTMHFSEITKQ